METANDNVKKSEVDLGLICCWIRGRLNQRTSQRFYRLLLHLKFYFSSYILGSLDFPYSCSLSCIFSVLFKYLCIYQLFINECGQQILSNMCSKLIITGNAFRCKVGFSIQNPTSSTKEDNIYTFSKKRKEVISLTFKVPRTNASLKWEYPSILRF